MVGRMYSEVTGDGGIHSRSSRTSSMIAWRMSGMSMAGMDSRTAPSAMRVQCRSMRKTRSLPSSPRKALRPSNRLCP